MIFGRHINRYYLRYLHFLLIGLASLIAVDYLQLIVPNLYQMVVNGLNQGWVLVDGVEVPFDMSFVLNKICMPMLIIIFSMVAGRFLWRVMFLGTAHMVDEDLRNRMFDNARHLSQNYYQVHKVGSLMSLFTNDLESVLESFAWGFMMFFDALFLSGLALSKMFRMSWQLTALSLIPTALLLASATVVGRYMMKKWDIRQEAYARLSDFSQESFSGIAVIKAFVKEAKELMAFRKLNVENEVANINHTKAAVLLRVLVMLFVESVVCIILGYGGYLVWKGTFNAGELVEFIGYFTAVIWPVMAVSELIDMTSRGRASLKRIGELLDAKPDVVDAPGAKPMGQIRGEIEFKNLSFRYPDGEFDVLKNVSFRIEAGENVGLVGKTGCGKTTLVDLILRTYNVPDGTLFVDGHDVNSVTIHSLREGCAYVPQDNYLFSDTITNNIAFAVDDFTHEQIEEAARLANVDESIRDFSNKAVVEIGRSLILRSSVFTWKSTSAVRPDFRLRRLRSSLPSIMN